jgi:hypothetical protein
LTKYKEDLHKFVKKSVVNVNDTMNLLLPVENNIAELNKTGSLELRASLQASYIRPSVRFFKIKIIFKIFLDRKSYTSY